MEIENQVDDIKLLEALILEEPDLEELEAQLEEFNIFEALGAVRVEVRHSDFLAFLLNPQQNHGLGDVFVKRLLQKALSVAQNYTPITSLDLDIWDLDELTVQREWQNIDLFLFDDKTKIAVVIENKVSSSEHSGQLRRYRKTIEAHYPGSKLLYLFLTPDGEEASDPNYISISYATVASIIENLIETRTSTLGPEVRILMTHYAQMLRRHIVSESELAELCRRIYRKHQRALDLIYEYRPDQQVALQELLVKLIQSEERCVPCYTTKSYIRFIPKEWDLPVLNQGEGWTPSGKMLMFEFGNFPNRLRLALVIGPGPLEVRQMLMDMSSKHDIFKTGRKMLGKSFNTIYTRDWLKSDDYLNDSYEDLETKIKSRWEQFIHHEFIAIRDIILKQDWIDKPIIT
jgi:hypothetical protein